MKKKETLFKEKVLPDLKKLGYFIKIQQVVRCGDPDIIGTINGVYIAIELKTDEGKLSELQKLSIAKILKAGGIALVATPSNWSKTYFFLLKLKRNSQLKKSRKYLLSLLQDYDLAPDI